jgi:hypothetical protein
MENQNKQKVKVEYNIGDEVCCIDSYHHSPYIRNGKVRGTLFVETETQLVSIYFGEKNKKFGLFYLVDVKSEKEETIEKYYHESEISTNSDLLFKKVEKSITKYFSDELTKVSIAKSNFLVDRQNNKNENIEEK